MTENERTLLEYLVAADGPGLIGLLGYEEAKAEVDAFVATSDKLRAEVRKERALPEDSQRMWDIGMEKADAINALRAMPYSEVSSDMFGAADIAYNRSLDQMKAEIGEARFANAREVYYAMLRAHGPRLKPVYGPGWYDDAPAGEESP